jgi:signal transduction histidine kinase
MPAALILLHPRKVGRPLRPRTIAVLGEVAAKLKKTLSTSLALERMGRLDGAIQQLDRLAALGGLVSEIVHEIRNPLVSVKTFLQLLPERLDDPEFHQGFRGVVEDEVGRLERMLEDLLRHARPAPTNAPVEPEARIPEAIATTLQLLTYRCRERGVELVKDIREELPALGLPEDALRQLLLNLLLNATEVTPRDGQIRIYADWSPESANHVELRIEDDGPGLDPALANNVFEPFWTTRQESPGGLGLAICKRIVDEAGGQIEVESEPTGGACFRIVLPIAS